MLIIERSPVYRAGLRHALERAPDIQIQIETADPTHAPEYVRALHPHIILLGLDPYARVAGAFARPLTFSGNGSKLIALAERAASQQELAMVDMRAAAFALKTIAGDALIDLIRRCAGGARSAALSPRETQVLQCAAGGESNKRIAYALNIREKTVKNHLTSVFRKLGVANRTQAVMRAFNHGWARLQIE